MGEQHYTVKQVAEKFDMNEETIRRWIRKGKLEAKKKSDKSGWRIPELALDPFLYLIRNLQKEGKQ